MDMPFAVVSLLFRHGLGVLGTIAMSTDLVSASQVEDATGAAMVIAAFAWSFARKWLRKQRTGSAA